MNKINRRVITETNIAVCQCPYCGSMPEIETTVKKDIKDTASKIGHTEVYCTACGLSAPFDVWQRLGEAIPESLCKDGE